MLTSMDIDVAVCSSKAFRPTPNLQCYGCYHCQWWHDNVDSSQQSKSRINCCINFFSANSIYKLNTCWVTLLMLSCKRLLIGERTTKDYPYQILWKWIMVPIKLAKGSILPGSYKVLTTTKHRMENRGWFLPWESGTMIAKLKFLQKLERYVDLGKATIYMYLAHNSEIDSNVE